jgi:PAP_fibrillin
MTCSTTKKIPSHLPSSATKLGRLLLLAALHSSHAWQLGQLFGRIKPPTGEVLVYSLPIAETKAELLSAISDTGNGKNADLETQKRVLKLVKYLEDNAPTPEDLLENPMASSTLDGVWYLQYTAPSDIAMDNEV